MNSSGLVTIIGGGIAGLSAAVFLRESGFRVKLIEASPKLGGRTYSFYDRERKQFFDNGQHILAGWYENTIEYLKIIGSINKLDFQNTLEIDFIDSKKKLTLLRFPDMPAPLNLISGLLRFKALTWRDKIALKNLQALLKTDKSYGLKFRNTEDLLKAFKQTKNMLEYFWNPFILAVFNTKPENVSAGIFLNVLKTGFGGNNNSVLLIPMVNLNELFIENALKYFQKNEIEVCLNKSAGKLLIKDKVEAVILDNGEKIYSDYYISAVSFFTFKKLFDEDVYMENSFGPDLLKSSSIISVHIFFADRITEELLPANKNGMTGLIGTTVQWIFKKCDHHISLVISGADDLGIKEMSNEEIFDLCKTDLNKTLKGFDPTKISGYRVIKEKRATFIPDNESDKFRPGQKTKYKNFFIAGDWTDTGLPATIESAVKSSRIITDSIINVQ